MNGKLSHYGTFTSCKNSCCYGNSFVAITIPILMCIQMHILKNYMYIFQC